MSTREKGKYLSLEERRKIEEMRSRGCSAEEIAFTIGVHYGTIYRELHRGETGAFNDYGVPVYSADVAHTRAATARANKGRKRAEGDGRASRIIQDAGA